MVERADHIRWFVLILQGTNGKKTLWKKRRRWKCHSQSFIRRDYWHETLQLITYDFNVSVRLSTAIMAFWFTDHSLESDEISCEVTHIILTPTALPQTSWSRSVAQHVSPHNAPNTSRFSQQIPLRRALLRHGVPLVGAIFLFISVYGCRDIKLPEIRAITATVVSCSPKCMACPIGNWCVREIALFMGRRSAVRGELKRRGLPTDVWEKWHFIWHSSRSCYLRNTRSCRLEKTNTLLLGSFTWTNTKTNTTHVPK